MERKLPNEQDTGKQAKIIMQGLSTRLARLVMLMHALLGSFLLKWI
jgi:hypothetical protein